MLKMLQARLQQYVNQELIYVQVGFRKGRGTRDQIVNIHWIIEKARKFQKNVYLCFIDYPKVFDCVDHSNYGKLLKRWEYQTILPGSWENCMCVKKQQLEPCMEQLIGSRLRKEYDRAVCWHPVGLTYKLSTSWEMSGWMSSKLELRYYSASKVCIVKAMIFPVVTNGHESWTVKKSECQRINVFELWCWRRSWKFLGHQGDQTSHY